jgi:hypothetical protein
MQPLSPPTLNKMLLARARELVERRPVLSRDDRHRETPRRLDDLRRSLGLYPEPARTDLQAEIQGVSHFDGYRVERLVFHSRPGVPVTAHLYLPDAPGLHSTAIYACGKWAHGIRARAAQAAGIGLALHGFAALLLDPPGDWILPEPEPSSEPASAEDGEAEPTAESSSEMAPPTPTLFAPEEAVGASLGSATDPELLLGYPALGQYAWNVIRALDYCDSRDDLSIDRAGITGAGVGGFAAMLAFALDSRIGCCAPVCCAGSLEEAHLFPSDWLRIPGILVHGDFADVLALRAPAPVLLIGSEDERGYRQTFDRLQDQYRPYRAEDQVQWEEMLGPPDFSRRMRESVYAFFLHHVKGQAARPYAPEPRPLTDGLHSHHHAGTLAPESQELAVKRPDSRSFKSLLEEAISQPYPRPHPKDDDLPAWPKYGRLELEDTGETVTLIDPLQGQKHGIQLEFDQIDATLCHAIGLSVPEFYAQILHQLLPGGPEGWEPVALTGDAVSAMIASMKTLVQGVSPGIEPIYLRAEGPIASMTAQFVKILRPGIHIHVTHQWPGWLEAAREHPALVQPMARYRKWPSGQAEQAAEEPKDVPF